MFKRRLFLQNGTGNCSECTNTHVTAYQKQLIFAGPYTHTHTRGNHTALKQKERINRYTHTAGVVGGDGAHELARKCAKGKVSIGS